MEGFRTKHQNRHRPGTVVGGYLRERWVGEVGAGKGGKMAAGRDLTWGDEHRYSVQKLCHRSLYNLINQGHPNKLSNNFKNS